MSDTVSYYVFVGAHSAYGPTALLRRRTDAAGGIVDESYAPRVGTWQRSPTIRRAEYGGYDQDLVCVHDEEAEQVAAWFQRIADDGRPNAGPAPIIGGWGLGTAWSLVLDGPVTERVLDTVLTRFGMTRRGTLGDQPRRDLGLRVLRNDESCRWQLAYYRIGDERSVLLLDFLRVSQGERTIQWARDVVVPLAAELGLTLSGEQVAPAPSWPLTEGSRPGWSDQWRLFAARFTGLPTAGALRTMRERLELDEESGDLESDDDDFGSGYLPNDGTYRARMVLRREDDQVWRVAVHIEGRRPPEDTVRAWYDRVLAAAAEAGLRFADDWLAPVPLPRVRTPDPAPPVRTSAVVHPLVEVTLRGVLTAETLDPFRAALGLNRRGRLADDQPQSFGTRLLRDEPDAVVRLSLHRTAADTWTVTLTHQAEPPPAEVVEQLLAALRAAAPAAGLTVERETRRPADDQ